MNRNPNDDYKNIDNLDEQNSEKISNDDTLDYVIPEAKKHRGGKISRHIHRHSHKHHHSMSLEDRIREADDFVYAVPHKKKHKKKRIKSSLS